MSGKRYRGSIPEARTKWQAERAETKIRDSIYEGKYGKQVEVPTLREFFEKTYLPWSKTNKRSWRHDEFRGRPLLEHMGKRRLDEISVIQIEKYKQARLKAITRFERTLSPAFVNRELELLSGTFSHAIDIGILIPNPCRKVKRLDEDNDRDRYLTYEEEEHLFAVLVGRREHLQPVVKLAIQTGMRKGELLSLRWANVDFERGVIIVKNSKRERTKGKRNRSIPMNSVAREELLALYDQSGESEYVFPSPKTGGPVGDIKTAFNNALEEAGIGDFRFHDLRHTAATRLGDAGVDAKRIKEILGHQSLATSDRYTHATDDGLRRAMETLTEKPKGRGKVLKIANA